MIYEHFFQQTGDQFIRAGLIGTGTYGMSLFSQVQLIPRLEIPVLCDRNIETLRHTCRQAGISEEHISLCNSRKAILQAMEEKKWAITQKADLLMDLPLDVIVECTGNPEAGARNAELAINHGKHVAMVNKETDSVIGPILHHRAKQSNVVYTPVDGDQHGLLIGLTSWARNLGLDVICGGKAHAHEFIYDENKHKISDGLTDITLTEQDMELFQELKSSEVHRTIEARRKLLKNLSHISMADLCESAIAANATGLMPDIPPLHGPIVRITEIPDVLCPQEAGGILSKQGTIDVVICLRRIDEAGLAGGVFIVVACENNDAWKFLKRKGILINRQGTYGLIYRPYHLLGIETPISIMCSAGWMLRTVSGVKSISRPRRFISSTKTRHVRTCSSLRIWPPTSPSMSALSFSTTSGRWRRARLFMR